MIKGFERESRLRVPKRGLRDFVARATDESNARALVVRTDRPEDLPSGPPADAAAVVAAWDDFPAVSFARRGGVPSDDIAVIMHGHISNAAEIRELYGLPPAEPDAPDTPPPPAPARAPDQRRTTRAGARAARRAEAAAAMPPPPPVSPNVEGAKLILELYRRRFEDKDGDPSDQPATALAACDGSFSFVLVDASRGAVLAARSAESEAHPLFWGTAPTNPGGNKAGEETDGEDWDGSMLLSNDLASVDGPCGGAAVAFPLGAFYYVDDSMDFGVIQRLRASGTKRKVRPMHRINSSGKVCGLGFYTESGNDLASMAQKFVA